MPSVVALDRLIDARRVWRGQVVSSPSGANFSTGHHFLDAVLPGGGWPKAALSEILTAAPGIGELSLLWPTLASLTVSGERVVLISPPHLPYPQAWIHAGVDLRQLSIIQADGRDALQDCMTAIRHHLPVAEAGAYLFANGERHLRRVEELAELYPHELLAQSLRIAERCNFDLDQLEYHYPHELVPAGHDATSWLRVLVERGTAERWPEGVPARARAQIEHELALIAELGYESYFLTVHDIVRFAREQHILCQGRGSAANSSVCFALGITELDPTQSRLLFERFLSRERNEPPDIDVDFEHERREDVIQYVFRRYGRTRAALTAVVNTYHGAGAIRDVAKALGSRIFVT